MGIAKNHKFTLLGFLLYVCEIEIISKNIAFALAIKSALNWSPLQLQNCLFIVGIDWSIYQDSIPLLCEVLDGQINYIQERRTLNYIFWIYFNLRWPYMSMSVPVIYSLVVLFRYELISKIVSECYFVDNCLFEITWQCKIHICNGEYKLLFCYSLTGPFLRVCFFDEFLHPKWDKKYNLN